MPPTKPYKVAQPVAPTPVKVRTTLVLSEQLYDLYAEQGTARGRTAEEEMSHRLESASLHTAEQPIYLSDKARIQLESIAGRMLRTEQDILTLIEQSKALQVGDVSVSLDDQLQKRIATRLFGQPYEDVVRREVLRGLRIFTGME